MKAQKVANGHYRVRKTVNKKSYSVSFDHKPTQKEITLALAQKMGQKASETVTISGTVHFYALKRMDKLRTGTTSTTTLNGYSSIINNTPEWFLSLFLGEVSENDCKRLIKEYGEKRSAATVHKLWSFYHSVFAEYRAEFKPTVKLPTKEQKAEYEPSTKDIQRIIEASEGSRYELPFKLAILGLRRGEICALTLADLDKNNVLTIDKDMVLDEDNNYYIKETPKTDASNRRILIPSSIADLIRKQGYVFQGNPHTINEALHRFQDKLNIPRFRLHLLRHFAAAFLHQQGFTDAQILAYGGWKDGSDVMRRIYRYNLDPEVAQSEIANKFDSIVD